MKSLSIIAVALLALVALCSSVPVVKQQVKTELQLRLDIYNDFLAGLFSGLVDTTFGSISNFLTQLIATNPLNVGKRDIAESRIDALSFLYDNILQDLFSGLVSNTFATIANTLNNLIQTNPLGVGKRALDVNIFQFIYDNILQDLFTGLVTNTFGTITNTLNNLIQTNPLGIGKRALDVNIFQFLYDNVLQDLFTGLVTNTFGVIANTLNNLIQTNPLGVGKRSINLAGILAILPPAASILIEKVKTFIHQAVAAWNEPAQLAQLVQNITADIKATITGLLQQLSQVIPSAIIDEITHILAGIQSTLIFWTSGLAGSLGPVLGPFLP